MTTLCQVATRVSLWAFSQRWSPASTPRTSEPVVAPGRYRMLDTSIANRAPDLAVRWHAGRVTGGVHGCIFVGPDSVAPRDLNPLLRKDPCRRVALAYTHRCDGTSSLVLAQATAEDLVVARAVLPFLCPREFPPSSPTWCIARTLNG